MRKMLIIAVLAMCTSVVVAQNVKESFEKEDSRAFDALFNAEVEMVMMNKDSKYSKREAVELMDAFFKVHNVKSFRRVHAGKSRGEGSNYEICELDTDKGTYRVNIYYSTVDGRQVIHQLHMEKD